MSEIASRVKAIIVDKVGVEESEVTNEASFTNDLGADSLDTVEPVSYTHLSILGFISPQHLLQPFKLVAG